jgi:hypothetical protein
VTEGTPIDIALPGMARLAEWQPLLPMLVLPSLLATVPEFGLGLFQQLAGSDVAPAAGALSASVG